MVFDAQASQEPEGEAMPEGMGFWHTITYHIRHGHLRAAGTEILVAAIMMLLAGMMLLGVNISELHSIGQAVARSNAALLQIADTDHNILGIELSLRGYALSLRPDYVGTYRTRAANLKKALDQLALCLEDQPKQAARLRNIRDFSYRQMATFDALLQLDYTDQATVVRVVTNPQMRDERHAAQDVLYAIRNDEMQRVLDRQSAAESKVRETFFMAGTIVAVAFLLAIVGLILAVGHRFSPSASDGESTAIRSDGHVRFLRWLD